MRPVSLPNWFYLLLMAAVVLLLTTAAPVRAQTSRLEALVNNATYSSAPTTVYKNSNFTMLLNVVYFYSKFPDAVVSELANINFYIYSSSSSSTFTAYAVSDTYNPDTINWNNQPSLGADLGSVVVTGVGWWSIDVSDYMNSVAGSGVFAVVLVNTSGGSTNIIRSLPAVDHIYIDYTAAPGTKPAQPTNCYDFETNQDAFGSNHFLLASGATVGQLAGRVDSGLVITGTAQTAATFPALFTSSADGFTVSGWWQTNNLGVDLYEFSTADGEFTLFLENGVGVSLYGVSNSSLVFTDAYTGDDWQYVGGGIAADGSAHIAVNASVYTATTTPLASTLATADLDLPTAGRVDQLMLFDYTLSREEHVWLWNGGRGRPCYAWSDPTQIGTMPPAVATPQYQIELPSGGTADIHMTTTAGEAMIAFAGLLLLFITLFSQIIRWGYLNTKR